MSDHDSDNEHHQTNNKLGLQLSDGNLNTENNVFSFRQRSRRGSSSCSENDKQYQEDRSQSAEQQHEDQSHQRSVNKLSDILNQVSQLEGSKNQSINEAKFEQNNQVQVEQKDQKPNNDAELEQNKKIECIEIKTIQEQVAKEQVKQSKQKEVGQVSGNIVKQQEVEQQKQEQTKDEVKDLVPDIKQQEKGQDLKMETNNESVGQLDEVEKKQKNEQKQIEKQQIATNRIKEQQKPTVQAQIIQSDVANNQTKNSTNNSIIQKEKSIQQKPIPKQQPSNNAGITNNSSKANKEVEKDVDYKKQLEDDLAMLRKNFGNKKKGSGHEKDADKHKINKTLIPSLNRKELEFQETPQTKAFELKMITTMAQQKKKENYQRLTQWDKRRAQSLAIHRNMVEVLQTEIDKRIKSSIQNLEIYSTFLREKARQEEKYVSHPVINTKYALQNNSISKSVYINCTVILNSLSDENAARCRKINDFIHLIRNDILRDSIEAHLLQSQKELLRIRQKISSLKAALRKHNIQTEEKTNELTLFFNENSLNMSIESDRDFFSTQLQFLQKASQQTLIQKKLGQNCLEYLQTAISEEIKRSKVIRQAMITFSKALQQCYNIEVDPAEIEQLSKGEQNKLIDEYYSLEQIFDERCLQVFKSHENIDHTKILTVDIFADFLRRFEFEGFDNRMILLKQFHTKYHPTNKNEDQKQQTCYVVITVDRWIHLFLSKEKTDAYAKPDVSFKASMKNLQIKQTKAQMLDLVMKDEKRNSMLSMFWESKNDRVYRLEFQKKDAREEFVDYISKIRG